MNIFDGNIFLLHQPVQFRLKNQNRNLLNPGPNRAYLVQNIRTRPLFTQHGFDGIELAADLVDPRAHGS